MTEEVPGLARYIDEVSAPVELSEVIDRHRGRRPRRVVAVAFVAVAAATLAVVALVPRHVSEAPPGSTPATSVTTLPPAPVDGDARTASATAGQPAFLSSTEGWVCGAPLRFTTDGGATWRSIGLGSPKYAFDPQCAFASGGRAWIAMSDPAKYPIPTIVHIVAGAQSNVTAVALPGAGENEWIRSLAFADAQHGWATTNVTNPSDGVSHPASGLYRTTDGGDHWERILSRPPVSFGLRFTSPTSGWGIDDRTSQRTDDGGRTWRTVPILAIPTFPRSPVGSVLISVYPFGDRIVLVGLLPTGNFGQLFIEVSNDDGEHWSLQTVSTSIFQPPGTAPWEFVALDAIHWRVAGPGGTALVVTDDAGTTWHVRSTLLPFPQTTGISFLTPDLGWAASCRGDPCHVARTTDAGKSWQLLN